ncbi:MAG: hypothetical protein CM15mP83_0490 [Flavobacteriaceae bacterium]|nr:MAG: hypothetical protein CM15mP83_0490 [Flavobacteriaceae bacterium]
MHSPLSKSQALPLRQKYQLVFIDLTGKRIDLAIGQSNHSRRRSIFKNKSSSDSKASAFGFIF